MNRIPLTEGAVLALYISADSSAPAAVAQLRLTNAIATSVDGHAVPLQPVSASIQIQTETSQTFPAESVLNAASLLPGPIAPGEIITILGPAAVSPAVLFNGIPGPVIYTEGGKMTAIVPLGPDTAGPAALQVRSQNQTLAATSVAAAPAAPA